MQHTNDTSSEDSLEDWIQEERVRAEARLLRNVSPPGALPGAIVASPSRSNPDYYYHWVRDSGIAVRAILGLYRSARALERQRYLRVLMEFVDFSRRIQSTAVLHGTGLGEPKFTVDGEPYAGPWARPQDDGPAIRAIELTHLAFVLLDEGEHELVREKLYDGRLPICSAIKADLEYIARRWRETCFDVWEEVRGHHFFTQVLERKALLRGAELATRLGDTGAAEWYLEQSRQMERALRLYWSPELQYIVATCDRDPRSSTPRSGLDSSVIIATLGGYSFDDQHYVESLYPVSHEHVLATIVAQERVFRSLYEINDPTRHIPGIAVGRYPQDDYDGYRTGSVGNPWPSITLGFAMYYYKLVSCYRRSGAIAVTPTSLPFFHRLWPAGDGRRALCREGEIRAGDPRFDETLAALGRLGDTYLQRVRYHINPDGSMSEQMNRVTGFQQGACDLTMGYAAFLLAAQAREQLRSYQSWSPP